MVDNRTNPLTKYFRQPKIYLRLPSKGRYYPAGSLDMPDSGELPVYAMTAKDELMFKTPDALLNGESVVEVINPKTNVKSNVTFTGLADFFG